MAGNLANFVLALLILLLLLGVGMTMDESRRAMKGELTGEKLENS